MNKIFDEIIDGPKSYIIDWTGEYVTLCRYARYNGIKAYLGCKSIDGLRFVIEECGKEDGTLYVGGYDSLSEDIECIDSLFTGLRVQILEDKINLNEEELNYYALVSRDQERKFNIKYIPFTEHVYTFLVPPNSIKIGRPLDKIDEGISGFIPKVGKPVYVVGELPQSSILSIDKYFNGKYLAKYGEHQIDYIRSTILYTNKLNDILNSNNASINQEYISLANKYGFKDIEDLLCKVPSDISEEDLLSLMVTYTGKKKGNNLRVVDITNLTLNQAEELINEANRNNILLIVINNNPKLFSIMKNNLVVITSTDTLMYDKLKVRVPLCSRIGLLKFGDSIQEFIIQ